MSDAKGVRRECPLCSGLENEGSVGLVVGDEQGALEELMNLDSTWSTWRSRAEMAMLARAREIAGAALEKSGYGAQLVGVELGYEDDLSYTVSWDETEGGRRRRIMSGPELAGWLVERGSKLSL